VLSFFGEGRGRAGERAYGSAREAKRALADARETTAGPIYKRAYAQGVDNFAENPDGVQVLQDAFKTPAVKSAWRDVQKRGEDYAFAEGVQLTPELLGSGRQPSLKGWQQIASDINDRIGRAVKKKPGTVRNLSRLRNRINAEIDRQNPDYQEARQIWSSSERFEDAVDEGRNFLKRTPSQVEDIAEDFSAADREGYIIGMVDALDDKMSSGGDLADATRSLRNRATRRKFRTVVGERADELFDLVNSAWNQQRTYRQVVENSATARRNAMREAEKSELPSTIAAMVFDAMTTGIPLATIGAPAARRGLQQAASRIPVPGAQQARDMAGEALLNPDPAEFNRLMQLIEEGGTKYRPSPRSLLPVLPAGVAAGQAATYGGE